MIIRLGPVTIALTILWRKTMPGLADLGTALNALDTAKANVATAATAIIAAQANPIPQSVIDRIGVQAAGVQATADQLTAATLPPAP